MASEFKIVITKPERKGSLGDLVIDGRITLRRI
jgi:hypothetical protein